jgi:hypothetical protein
MKGGYFTTTKIIRVWCGTKDNLDGLKLCKEESYNAVILRLIDYYNRGRGVK